MPSCGRHQRARHRPKYLLSVTAIMRDWHYRPRSCRCRWARGERRADRGDAALRAVIRLSRSAGATGLLYGGAGCSVAHHRRMPCAHCSVPGNASVLHVVGLPDHPRKVFPLFRHCIGPAWRRWLRAHDPHLDASFARTGAPPAPQVLGQGLYGPSRFYRAVENFHLFNVCNHWVARQLSAAGIATAPVADTLPAGLLLDLKWRSGLSPMPRDDGRPL